jgi:hypothetical protein
MGLGQAGFFVDVDQGADGEEAEGAFPGVWSGLRYHTPCATYFFVFAFEMGCRIYCIISLRVASLNEITIEFQRWVLDFVARIKVTEINTADGKTHSSSKEPQRVTRY